MFSYKYVVSTSQKGCDMNETKKLGRLFWTKVFILILTGGLSIGALATKLNRYDAPFTKLVTNYQKISQSSTTSLRSIDSERPH